jgi:hypothetical protein
MRGADTDKTSNSPKTFTAKPQYQKVDRKRKTQALSIHFTSPVHSAVLSQFSSDSPATITASVSEQR